MKLGGGLFLGRRGHGGGTWTRNAFAMNGPLYDAVLYVVIFRNNRNCPRGRRLDSPLHRIPPRPKPASDPRMISSEQPPRRLYSLNQAATPRVADDRSPSADELAGRRH